MNEEQETTEPQETQAETTAPAVAATVETPVTPTPRNRGGRPRKAASEPQMVLPDMPSGDKVDPVKPSGRKPRPGGDANITQITEGLTAALTALSAFCAPFLPCPPGVPNELVWALKPEEAKSLASPAAKIAHRHGAGKALHPDVIDALGIGYALLVIVKARQELLYAIHVRATNESPQNASVYPATTNYQSAPSEALSGPPKPVEDPAAVQGLGAAFREINLGSSDGLGLAERVAELENG